MEFRGRANVGDIRRRAPRLPMLAYYPDTQAALDLVPLVSELALVTCKMQMPDAREAERLRRLLAPLVKRYPVDQFRDLLRPVLVSVPAGPVRRFLDVAVSRVAAGWLSPPGLDALAAAAGCSRRHLERCCAVARLPAPHRLLDRLVLLWVTWATAEHGIPERQAAGHLGLTRRDLTRLDARTVGRTWVARAGTQSEVETMHLKAMLAHFATFFGLGAGEVIPELPPAAGRPGLAGSR